jgi:lambda family phage tail tape measure protein
MAERYRERATDTRAHAFDAVGPAAQALGDAVRKADSAATLDEAANAAGRVTTALDASANAAKKAGKAHKKSAEEVVTGWAAVVKSLADYAEKAREIGADVGKTLVGAFKSAEDAVGEFVKTGKLKFGDLVTSLIADLAKLAARRFILGPIANALSGALGSLGSSLFGVPSPATAAAGLFGSPIYHTGGIVGGPAARRAGAVEARGISLGT